MEPDDETGFVEHPSRARRAKAVGAAALLVLAIAAIAYVRPSLAPSAATSSVSTAPHPPTGYQLDAVAFVDPSTGWVLADLDNSTFTVLATTNAGRTWKTVLLSSSPRPAEYMRFFDRRGGVVVALGPSPTVYATGDGGVHWSPHTLTGIGYAIAASFVDPKHGWLLRYGPQGLDAGATELLGTADGGTTWKNLGDPAGNQAQAFAVSFSDSTHGWLDTVASRPQAFTTSDGGATWRPVALPTPAGGWPAPHGSYFVAARPTLGGGVVVTVINSQHINGRNAAGNVVLNYPPLTVRTYDGGSPVEYIYSTFVDSATDGAMRVFNTSHRPGPAISQTPPAGQVGFRSTDGGATWSSFMPPAPGGTIGYTDATAWWWVGPGESAQTSDGGQTWSPQRPDPVTNPLPGSLIVLDPSHAWLSALDDQGPVLFTTSDGGGFWNEVRLPAIAG